MCKPYIKMKYIVISFFLLFANLSATEYFVAQGGTGNGSFNSPFGTLDEALFVASANDIITLRTGTYAPPSSPIVQPYLTIQSYQGERAHITKTYGEGVLNIIWVDATADYFTLRNLELSGGDCYIVKFDNDFGYQGASNDGAIGGIIENCELHHSGTDVIKITPLCDDITIRNCDIHHSGIAYTNPDLSPCAEPNEEKNCQGIDNTNGDRMIVQDCYIHDIAYDNPAVFFKGGSKDCIVERNLFESAFSGIWIGAQTDEDFYTPADNPQYYNSFNGVVRNNIIKNMKGDGIAFYSANNPKAYNNTLINCGKEQIPEDSYSALSYKIQSFHNGEQYISPPTLNALFANNIVIREDGTVTPYHDFFIEIRGDENLLAVEEGSLKMYYNRYWDDTYSDLKTRNWNDPNGPINDYSSLAEWKASSLHNSSYAEAQTLFADPSIADDGTPLSSSNCMGSGVSISGLTNDFYSSSRTGSIDIGAVQTNVSVELKCKIFLEGVYNSSTNLMNTDLQNKTPYTSPYPEDPKTLMSMPDNVVDWVLVQLRSLPNGLTTASKSALLLSDGSIITDNRIPDKVVFNVSPGSYYIVIKHRNHLAVMSKEPVPLSGNTSTLYDFTTGSEKFYGSGGAKQIDN